MNKLYLRKSSWLLLLFILNVSLSYSKENKYAVSEIPEHLLKNANVVKRYESIHFSVNKNHETYLTKKYALTILNEKGADEAVFVAYYDKQCKIKYMHGTLYNDIGEEIKKAGGKDFIDLSGVNDNNLMDDVRVRRLKFSYYSYPYTVEFEEEEATSNDLFFDKWIPQERNDIAVEQSEFLVTMPQSDSLRYKCINFTGLPKIGVEDDKTYTWEIKDLKAFKSYYGMPSMDDIVPKLLIGPVNFEVEGNLGNMSSWIEFGHFLCDIKKNKDHLPPNIINELHKMVDTAKSAEEKISILYQYMQKRTRYVSVQLGLGGIIPYDAEYVAKYGFGDCKALSNYMYSLLKAVGIKSYYTLVKAGEYRKMVNDFSLSQFNHAILCVPVNKDTIWLECTSQTKPAGYMGGFTGNRKALLLDETGGYLVNTPEYKLKDNMQIRKLKGKINEGGALVTRVSTTYTGMQQDELSSMIEYLTKDKIIEVLRRYLDLSNYEMLNYSYQSQPAKVPSLVENLDLNIGGFASQTGKRLFIEPNVLNKAHLKLDGEDAQFGYAFYNEYKDIDSVEIAVPDGYIAESLPGDTSLVTKFGTYKIQIKFANNTIKYTRTREQYSGFFPQSDSKELEQFLNAIYYYDHRKVVLELKK